jgi:hypothetical protein
MDDRKIWGIRSVKGLDIQVSNQKKPVFLIDLPPRQQSEILSIGNEAERLDKMVIQWKSRVRDARSTLSSAIKDVGEISLVIKDFIDVSRNLDTQLRAGCDEYKDTLSDLSTDTSEDDLRALQAVANLWNMDQLTEKSVILKNLFDGYRQLEDLITDAERHEKLSFKLEFSLPDMEAISAMSRAVHAIRSIDEGIHTMANADHRMTLAGNIKHEKFNAIQIAINEAKISIDNLLSLRNTYGNMVIAKKRIPDFAPTIDVASDIGCSIHKAIESTRIIQSTVADMVLISAFMKKEKGLNASGHFMVDINTNISSCLNGISTLKNDDINMLEKLTVDISINEREKSALESDMVDCKIQIKTFQEHFANDCPLCGKHVSQGVTHGH